MSVDATPAILREYERRGRLRYLVQRDDNYAQGRWVTEMARMAAVEFEADWVINNDADEFWWPPAGNLKSVLAEVPSDTMALEVPRRNFVPRNIEAGQCFAEVMTVRETRSLNALGCPLQPKVCHRAFPDVEIVQGNHAALRGGIPLPTDRSALEILHFPVRSYGQFANKIIKGGAAYNRNRDLPSGMGETWRMLYELWQQGRLPAYFDEQVFDEAAIEAGLRHGTLQIDKRLREALRACARLNMASSA
jgi:hypothetical protein